MDDDFYNNTPIYSEPSYDKERQLYNRLIGLFQIFPDVTNVHTSTTTSDHWEQFNRIIEEIAKLGHSDFAQYTITQDKIGQFNGRPSVNMSLLKSRMNAMLWEMSAKFFFQNPNELIGKSAGGHFVQQVNTQQQNQHQKQEQEIELTIEQKIDVLDRVINENMSPEQIAAIAAQLEAFKKEPNMWKNAQSLIQGVLGFGKDIAAQTIGAILAFYITNR